MPWAFKQKYAVKSTLGFSLVLVLICVLSFSESVFLWGIDINDITMFLLGATTLSTVYTWSPLQKTRKKNENQYYSVNHYIIFFW